jgi:hypothetical protein
MNKELAVLAVLAFTTVTLSGCGVTVRATLGSEFRAEPIAGVTAKDGRSTPGITLRGLSPYDDKIETDPSIKQLICETLSQAIGELRPGDQIEATVKTATCTVRNEYLSGYADFSLEVEARFNKGGVYKTRVLNVSRTGDKVGAGFGGIPFKEVCLDHLKSALALIGQQAQQFYAEDSRQ